MESIQKRIVARDIDLDKDYATLCKWWSKYDTNIPERVLSNIGLMVEDVAAAWLYITNSEFAIIAFPISNKEVSSAVKDEVFSIIIKRLEGIARSLNYTIISVHSEIDSMIERYKRLGYTVTDDNMTNLMRKI
jgi:hypothetical protein